MKRHLPFSAVLGFVVASQGSLIPWRRDEAESSWAPARATSPADENLAIGVVPVPTAGPTIVELELAKRSVYSVGTNTCGFISGDANEPIGCKANVAACVFNTYYHIVDCCANTDLSTSNCHIRTVCLDYSQSTLSTTSYQYWCNDPTYPYCVTYLYQDGPQSGYDWYDCAATRVNQVVFATPTSGASSSGNPAIISSQPGTSTTATPTHTPAPSPAPSSTPIGAIVGGVVGGLAVIGAIIFGIIFMMRRRTHNPQVGQPPVNAANFGSPPQQQQPPMAQQQPMQNYAAAPPAQYMGQPSPGSPPPGYPPTNMAHDPRMSMAKPPVDSYSVSNVSSPLASPLASPTTQEPTWVGTSHAPTAYSPSVNGPASPPHQYGFNAAPAPPHAGSQPLGSAWHPSELPTARGDGQLNELA